MTIKSVAKFTKGIILIRNKLKAERKEDIRVRDRAVASMGQGGGQLPPPPILGVAPQSGLAPATVVSLSLAMGQLRLKKCIKIKRIQ